MLSTSELQRYIYTKINDRISNLNFSNIYFKVFDNWCFNDGIYVFSDDEKYHFLEMERGYVLGDETSGEPDIMLLYVISIISAWIGMRDAVGHEDYGKAYREKRAEILSLFGDIYHEHEKTINEEGHKFVIDSFSLINS